jgi:phage terminase small subunit
MELTEEQEKMASELTKLQRRTVMGVLEGKSNRQAYYEAGGASKTHESADATVSRMLSDTKVRSFMDSVMNSATEKAGFKFEEALGICEKIAKNELESSNHRIGAIKQASDMLGWNAPKKNELTGKDGSPLEVTHVERIIVDATDTNR